MPNRFDLPPVECCRGTSPSHAANCLPLAKFFASPIDAISALAVIGPTRMAYERVIPIVDITAKLLSNALSQN